MLLLKCHLLHEAMPSGEGVMVSQMAMLGAWTIGTAWLEMPPAKAQRGHQQGL